MSGRVGALVLATLFASCYRPAGERACHVFCEVNAFTGERGPCPGTLTCDADGICRQDGACPSETDVDAATNDAGPDGGGPDGRICFGSANGLLNLCFSTPPVGTLFLSSFSTTSSSLTCTVVHQNANNDPDEDICVVAAGDVIIPQATTLRVNGTHPVVIVASNTITVSGNIDVSAGGAGGASPKCGTGTAPSFDIGKESYGGGAGGSFQIAGAPGGPIYTDGTMTTTDDGGGPALAKNPVGTVRAGCNGQAGAAPTGVLSVGGPAGGAVYLIAATSITIADGSWINASGGGGSVPNADTGGGGGGAGGMIGLDAPVITGGPTSALLANGGGGACGGTSNTPGFAGGNASVSTPTAAPLGGCADGLHIAGGVGGDGAAAYNNPSGGQAAFAQGAGGGGGAIGWILAFGGATNFDLNHVSPPFPQ